MKDVKEKVAGGNPAKNRSLRSILSSFIGEMFTTEENYDEEVEEELQAIFALAWKIMLGVVGTMLCIIISSKYSEYLWVLHENRLWFTNLKEVEREISFRTEQGLYYSYYKQILEAPSYWEGLHSLAVDNKTEFGRTINVFHRFNILPECFLSAVYSWLEISDPPILFYVRSVFWLHGFYIGCIYLTAWHISGSFLAGVLASFTFVIHRVDTTRVNYTVPLRESFALPFLFLQLLVICKMFRSPGSVMLKLLTMFVSVIFLLNWQFSPFIMLCEIVIVTLLSRLRILPLGEVFGLIATLGASLLVTSYIQSFPPLLLSSPALSMILPALVLTSTEVHFSKKNKTLLKLLIPSFEMEVLLLATAVVNWNVKKFLALDADSHLYQLLLAKLKFSSAQDFDTKLYMCNQGFSYIDLESLQRISQSGLLPTYSVALIAFVVWILWQLLHYGSTEVDLQEAAGTADDSKDMSYFQMKPDFAFILGMSLMWCVLSLLFVRLKVLWMPTVCITFGTVLADCKLYRSYLTFFYTELVRKYPWVLHCLKGIVCSVVLLYLGYRYWPVIASEIWPKELYEFWDPDTVELMEWISNHTPPSSVFAGSMQLLAAVKLSTGRSITNHPHHEDSWLRKRTHEVYQVYGCKSPEEIHHILNSIGAVYAILEDSICLDTTEHSHTQCRLIDIVDLHNKHVLGHGNKNSSESTETKHRRFCDEVRYGSLEYVKYFSLVMRNKTFRVYRIAAT